MKRGATSSALVRYSTVTVLGLSAATGIAAISPVCAGEWEIDPVLQVQETLTDNVRIQADDEQADLISTVSAGLTARGRGRRAQLNLDYLGSYDKYIEADDLDGLRHRLSGIGSVEVVEDNLFVDSRASIQERAVSRGAGGPATQRTSDTNNVRVVNYSVSPYLRNAFGGWARSELRYRFAQTLFLNTAAGQASGEPNNAVSNEVLARVDSGREFTRFNWTLEGEFVRNDPEQDEAFTRRTARATGRYRIDRVWSPLARIGYEKISDPDISDEANSGLIWSVGARVTPGPRTLLQAEYGERFGGKNISAEANYVVSPFTTVSASYQESIQTQQSTLVADLSGLVVTETGLIIDPGTGQVLDPSEIDVDLVDSAFEQKRLNIVLTGERGRNRFNLSGFAIQRDFSPGGTDETVIGARGQFQRQLSRQTALNMSANYSATIDSRLPGGEDWILSGNVGLDHQLAPGLTGGVSYVFRHQAFESRGNVTENVALVNVRKTF